MQRAWIQDVDADHVAIVHAIDGQDLDTLVTYAREAEGDQKSGSDWKHAARVDQAVIIDWCNKRGITFAQFMRDQGLITKFLDDPVNAPFRVWKGKI